MNRCIQDGSSCDKALRCGSASSAKDFRTLSSGRALSQSISSEFTSHSRHVNQTHSQTCHFLLPPPSPTTTWHICDIEKDFDEVTLGATLRPTAKITNGRLHTHPNSGPITEHASHRRMRPRKPISTSETLRKNRRETAETTTERTRRSVPLMGVTRLNGNTKSWA